MGENQSMFWVYYVQMHNFADILFSMIRCVSEGNQGVHRKGNGLIQLVALGCTWSKVRMDQNGINMHAHCQKIQSKNILNARLVPMQTMST